MKFGQKKSEIKETEGDGIYLRNFKKGDTKVRFLQEPGDWFGYREHFNPDGGSFPCTQDKNSCPGCNHEADRVRTAPRRYATFVYLVDQKRVLPFKMGQKLSDRLEMRQERNEGTLLSRDYVIIRTGQALDTEYDVDQDEKYPVDTEQLWKDALKEWGMTPEEIVEKSFREVWGDPDKFTAGKATSSKPITSPVSEATSTKTATADVHDVPDNLLSKEELAEKYKKDEEVEITEAELKSMTRPQLIDVWTKADFGAYDEDWGKSEFVTEILNRASN